MRYCKKDNVIEAIQWTGSFRSYEDICNLANGECYVTLENNKVFIHNPDGSGFFADLGWYVIRDESSGIARFYTCDKYTFEETYERVEDS